MASINSKKLLPPSKQSKEVFLVPAQSILPSKPNVNKLKPVDQKGSSFGYDEDLKVIKKKVIKITDLIKNNLLLDKKSTERKRKQIQRENSEEREKKLEEKDLTGKKLGTSLISKVPGIGLFDRILRFAGFTLLGFIANNYAKYIPQLIDFFGKLKPAFETFEYFAKGLVDNSIKFIEFGYNTYDKINKVIGDIGGEGAQKTFDEFSGELSKLLNGAISASMLIASTATKTPGGASGGLGSSASKTLGSAIPKPTSGFGAGTAMTPGRYRLPGQSKASGFALEQARNKATQTSLNQASKQLASQGAKQSLKSLVGVPVIGSLIGFIIDTVVFREKPTRAAAGAIGSAIGQGIGIAVAGGTTFGLGAGLGMLVGGFAGDWLGKALYDGLTGYQPEPIPAKAQGGSVTRGGRRTSGAISRTVARAPKVKPKIVPQKPKPGQNVTGGRDAIERLYTEKGLSALETTSSNVAEIKAPLAVNTLMSASVNLAMGQKPTQNLYKQIGDTFGSAISNLIDVESNKTINSISSSLAMANGGVVPPRTFKGGMSLGERIGKLVAETLRNSIESSANQILQNLNTQILGGPAVAAGGDGGAGAGGYAEGAENFVSSKEVYSYLKSKGLSHNHILGMLANIQAESSFNAGAIGDNGKSGGLFQHHAERFSGMVAFAGKDWAKNWKRQIDYALREDAGKEYVSKQFSNASDASSWFTLNFEKPANREQKARDRIGNLSNFGSDGTWKGGGSIKYVAPNKNIALTFIRGMSGNHGGADIAAVSGTPLRAVSDGTIVYAGAQPGGWGNFIVYKDKNGLYHLYGHLQNGYKKSGNFKMGDILAKVGMTGRTTGPHLHWELGTGWNGGVITGRISPLSRYDMNAPFFTEREKPSSGIKVSPLFQWKQSSAPKELDVYTDVTNNNNMIAIQPIREYVSV